VKNREMSGLDEVIRIDAKDQNGMPLARTASEIA
jgi:hypothetical protein